MSHARHGAACCILPSGRVAVVGGCADGVWLQGPLSQGPNLTDGDYHDGEIFDLETRTWSALPPMELERSEFSAVPVAGGMLVSGQSSEEIELYDEESERWFELPHPMIKPRIDTVALPVAVLAQHQAAARQAQIAALAAQARDIGPWSAEEKERFAEAAGWGS